MGNGWRERLREAIAESGQSKRALSQATGFGENYVQQLLKDEKDPSFPRLAKLLSILGASATLYVILGMKSSKEEAQLRSALISHGVDRKHLDAAVLAIKGFVDASLSDGQSQSDQPHAQSESANHHHAKVPS